MIEGKAKCFPKITLSFASLHLVWRKPVGLEGDTEGAITEHTFTIAKTKYIQTHWRKGHIYLNKPKMF